MMAAQIKQTDGIALSAQVRFRSIEDGYARFDESAGTASETTSEAKGVYSIDGYMSFPDAATDKSDTSGASFVISERAKRLTQAIAQLGAFYSEQVELHPVRTKALTTGMLSIVGDIVAQRIELHFDPVGDSTLDTLRLLAMFIEGVCYSGPLLHYVFEFYECIFPIQCLEDSGCNYADDTITVTSNVSIASQASMSSRAHPSAHADYMMSQKKFLNAFLHVAFDQIIMAFPYVGGLMIITAVVEGHASDLGYELRHDYFHNIQVSWAAALVLAPFQILAFRYLDTMWRVLAVNIQDVIWVAVMSYMTHRNRDDDGWMD